jgi:hypothetical protein
MNRHDKGAYVGHFVCFFGSFSLSWELLSFFKFWQYLLFWWYGDKVRLLSIPLVDFFLYIAPRAASAHSGDVSSRF